VARPVGNLLRLLLDKRRFDILADIAQSYRELLDEHVGLVRATVVSARCRSTTPCSRDCACYWQRKSAGASI